ncbi:MAG TPA: hypothetical protein VIJ00_18910 [Nakamurella sp.]
MNLQKRDIAATGLVAAAVVIYLLWLLDAVPSGMSDVRATGAVILALGFAASATAVVPTFGQLLHGNRAYLAVTSLLGLVALIAGVVMLVGTSEPALAVVMVAMVTMWLIATIHHSRLAKTTPPASADQVRETGRPKATV